MTTSGAGAFVIVAEFEVRPEAIETFLEAAIADASASVANEPGCRQFDVTRSNEEPNRVLLYEVYDSAAAFEAHLAMPHLQTFRDRIEPLVVSRQVRRLTRVHG
jgi:(4S)-4-hydroxy-5-phosphonooxypentane-2,3-dione isomerase